MAEVVEGGVCRPDDAWGVPEATDGLREESIMTERLAGGKSEAQYVVRGGRHDGGVSDGGGFGPQRERTAGGVFDAGGRNGGGHEAAGADANRGRSCAQALEGFKQNPVTHGVTDDVEVKAGGRRW